MNTNKRAALYIRVSTEEQARHGLSLSAQLENLQQYAKNKGYKIVGIYTDDGASARKSPFSRKAFRQLMEDVQWNRIDRILFIKLDRWFRSVRDYYKAQDILDAHGVDWETTQEQYNTTTTNGRLMLNIKLSVAQNESDMTSDRIRFVFEQKRAKHEVLSGFAPLGYKIENKHLVPDENAPIIANAFNQFIAYPNLQQLTNWFHSQGIHYNVTSIRKLLRNERYVGRNKGDLEYCPPIVSDQQFYTVQDMLDKNLTVKRTASGLVYIFTGLLRCPICGHKLTSSCAYSGTHKYKRYRCSRHWRNEDCSFNRGIAESKLEKQLLAHFDDLYEHFNSAVQEEQKNNTRIDTQVIKKKQERLKELFLNELITLDEYKKDYAKYAAMLPSEPRPSIQPSLYNGMKAADIEQLYKTLPDRQKQAFLRQIIDYIDFDADLKPIIHFK